MKMVPKAAYNLNIYPQAAFDPENCSKAAYDLNICSKAAFDLNTREHLCGFFSESNEDGQLTLEKNLQSQRRNF